MWNLSMAIRKHMHEISNATSLQKLMLSILINIKTARILNQIQVIEKHISC